MKQKTANKVEVSKTHSCVLMDDRLNMEDAEVAAERQEVTEEDL